MKNQVKISIPSPCHENWQWLRIWSSLQFTLTILFMLFGNTKATAQERLISGLVYDVARLPVPEANVIVKGTQKAVVTNYDGYYTISVAIGDTLLFSHPAFKKAEIPTDGKEEVNIILEIEPYECYFPRENRRTFLGRILQGIGSLFRKNE